MDYRVIFFIVILAFGLVLIVKNKSFAKRIQISYVTQAKKSNYNNVQWESPFYLGVFRVMMIFFGLLLVFGAYPLIYGPFN